MAQPIRCDTGNDDNIAVMLITNLNNGTVTGLCPHCVPAYLDGISKVFRTALEPQPAEQPADGDSEVTGDGTRKRARPRTRRSEPQDVPTGADDLAAELAATDAAAD